jgi:hypothetical protein
MIVLFSYMHHSSLEWWSISVCEALTNGPGQKIPATL